MAKDQMFSQMRQAALSRLAGRDPNELARNTGMDYDDGTKAFRFRTLGIDTAVQYPDYTFSPKLPEWHALVILHCMDLADGTPVTGRAIPFAQMKSGMVRGGGIDRKCELAIQNVSSLSRESLAEICERIGGEQVDSHADVAYRFSFLPRFPATLKIWLADEDFPASGRLFVDASADHYLTIEDAVTVAEIIIEAIRP